MSPEDATMKRLVARNHGIMVVLDFSRSQMALVAAVVRMRSSSAARRAARSFVLRCRAACHAFTSIDAPAMIEGA